MPVRSSAAVPKGEIAWPTLPRQHVLLLTGVAVASLVAKVLLVERWSSLDCSDSRTLVLDRLVIGAIFLSTLAVAVGIVAIVSRRERRMRVVLGIVVSLLIAALVVIPDALGGYQCGVQVP